MLGYRGLKPSLYFMIPQGSKSICGTYALTTREEINFMENIMVKATIYTAPKCPHSANLKQFLAEVGITYEEKCILADPALVEEVFQKSQQKGIPVTVIESEVFVGFDRRTERRLRRTLGV